MGHAFGRWEDRAASEAFFASQRFPTVTAATADWEAGDDDKDIDLCEIYEVTTGRKWNSRNQNPRGFCVGFGNAKITTLSLAVAASLGKITYPGDVAVEPIYGGMRFEIGAKQHGSNLNRGGDGGVGTWAAEWLLKFGILLMQPYGSIDLTNYSIDRCAKWGGSGVPDELEPVAKMHPLDVATLCETAEDAWKLIGQLYPLVHCSNQGFRMNRNSDGTCTPSGSWPHCAGWSGRFTLKDGSKVLRYDNSWDGDEDGSGYLGIPILVDGKFRQIKLNGNQFLVHLDTVDRMCKSGRETYAFAGDGKFAMQRQLYLN